MNKMIVTCEDCIYPAGSGCGHKYEIVLNDDTYVENSHYSYYQSKCPCCGKINKDV